MMVDEIDDHSSQPGHGAPATSDGVRIVRGRHRVSGPSKHAGRRPTTEAPRWRWVALTVLLVAGFMDLMDVTIVYVAIPAIQRSLNATYVEMEWIVSAYVLGFALLLLIGAQLGDRLGRRRVMLVGLAGFTASSLACGLADGPGTLIAARWIQGAMAGLMIPQILAIIHVTFDPRERAKALAIWGGVLGGASVAGVILGGVLVQYDLFGAAWRPIFLVNVPIGLVIIPAATYVVAESRSTRTLQLDPVGMMLSSAAVGLLVYPLTMGRTVGWPWWTWLMMLASAVVVGVFVIHQRRRSRLHHSALVHVDLFRSHTFRLGMLAWGVFWIGSGGFFLVWTLYLQIGLGWTPLHAGLTAATFSVGAAAAAGVSMEILVPRYGRRILSIGSIINAVGFGAYLWAAVHYGPTITSAQMILPLLLTGVGFGLLVAPMVDLILSDLPTPDAGSASGLLSTVQQLGMALGVALAAIIFFAELTEEARPAIDAVTPTLQHQLAAAGIQNEPQHAVLSGFDRCVEDRAQAVDPTIAPASCHLPAALPGASLLPILAAAGTRAGALSFVQAFATTLWFGIALLLVVFVGTFSLPARMRTIADRAAPSINAPRH